MHDDAIISPMSLLDIVLACRQSTAAEHMTGDAVELRAGARGVGLSRITWR